MFGFPPSTRSLILYFLLPRCLSSPSSSLFLSRRRGKMYRHECYIPHIFESAKSIIHYGDEQLHSDTLKFGIRIFSCSSQSIKRHRAPPSSLLQDSTTSQFLLSKTCSPAEGRQAGPVACGEMHWNRVGTGTRETDPRCGQSVSRCARRCMKSAF